MPLEIGTMGMEKRAVAMEIPAFEVEYMNHGEL